MVEQAVSQLYEDMQARSLEYPPMHTYKWAATEQALNFDPRLLQQ